MILLVFALQKMDQDDYITSRIFFSNLRVFSCLSKVRLSKDLLVPLRVRYMAPQG